MAIKKINYHGNSKILLRLCEVVNSIIDAGTGGSTVSYQQTLQSGTETGEITIDGVAKKMYAPTPPTKVSDLQNDTGFITSTVSNLINYYTKTETYTKAEVDAAVAAVSTLNLLVVQTLPTQDISTTTIYLVPKQTAGTQNVYDEYIYIVTGGSGSWELIGDTTVDLSNYYTKTEIDNKLTANNISFDDSDCQSIQNVSNVQDALEAVDIGLSTHTDAISSLVSTVSGKADDNQTFTEAQTRANIASGESFATILGKIKKWFTDLKDLAFIAKDGSTSKYLRGDGTWQTFPTIPAAQVNSDWNANSGVAQILNKPTIPAAVAVKGNAESNYRTGDVNLTSANIGAVDKTGDTMSDRLKIERASGSDIMVDMKCTSNGNAIGFGIGSGGVNRGIYDRVLDRWVFLVDANGDIYTNGAKVPQNGTLAKTSDLPTDFVSKTNGGTFDNYVTVKSANATPFRIKTTSSGTVYLEFSNSSGYLGWYAVNTSKEPVFQSQGGSDKVLSYKEAEKYVENNYNSRQASMNVQFGDGRLRYFMATSTTTTGKPTSGDAHIIDLAWDNTGGWDGQLAIPTDDSESPQWRTQTSGTWGNWKTLIDSAHIGSQIVAGIDTLSEGIIKYGGALKFKQTAANGNYSYNNGGFGVKNGLDTGYATIYASNVSSSLKFKENVQTMTDEEAEKLLKIRVVTYDYKRGIGIADGADAYNQRGVIAEEVNSIIPYVVIKRELGSDGSVLEPYGVEYHKFIPYLIKMIQIQQDEIDELKAQIKEIMEVIK